MTYYDNHLFFKAILSSINNGIEIVSQEFPTNNYPETRSLFSFCLNPCNNNSIANASDEENGYEYLRKSIEKLPIPHFIPFDKILSVDKVKSLSLNGDDTQTARDDGYYDTGTSLYFNQMNSPISDHLLNLKLTYLTLYKENLYPTHIYLQFDINTLIDVQNIDFNFNIKLDIINKKDNSNNTIT